MMSRVSAEFENPELAQSALIRIRDTVNEVYRTGIQYDRRSDRTEKLGNGTVYTVLPTAVTTYNYFTATTERPASEDVVPEPRRRRTARAFAICDASCAGRISAIFSAMGGLKIKSEI